jgi:hypothetical protein
LIDTDCARAIGAIDELGDGELGRVKWLLLRRHARKCGACGARLKRMETVIQALAELDHVPPPADLVDVVMACLVTGIGAVERHAQAEEHGRRNLVLVAGAAGLGVAVAVALAIVRWVVGREHDDGLAPIGSA